MIVKLRLTLPPRPLNAFSSALLGTLWNFTITFSKSAELFSGADDQDDDWGTVATATVGAW